MNLLLSLLFLCFGIATKAFAECSFENTIQVQGRGSVTTSPDSFSLSFSVETEAKLREEAKRKNNDKVSAIVARVKNLNIVNLKVMTEGFYASPVYKYDKSGRSTITGYKVSHSMRVKVEGLKTPQEDAIRLLDTVMDNGATNTGQPVFYLDDNNIVFDEALKLAIQQAKKRANLVAEEAGTKIIGIYTIETYSQSTPRVQQNFANYEARLAKVADAEAGSPTPISAGQMDVEATVTIRFDLQD